MTQSYLTAEFIPVLDEKVVNCQCWVCKQTRTSPKPNLYLADFVDRKPHPELPGSEFPEGYGKL